jgi:hypothetical protein
MNWFTYLLIALAVVSVVVVGLEVVRPRRAKKNLNTNQREIEQGDAFLRGGNELNNRMGHDGGGPL